MPNEKLYELAAEYIYKSLKLLGQLNIRILINLKIKVSKKDYNIWKWMEICTFLIFKF